MMMNLGRRVSFLASPTPFLLTTTYNVTRITARGLATSAATASSSKAALTENDIIPSRPDVKPRKKPTQMVRPSEPLPPLVAIHPPHRSVYATAPGRVAASKIFGRAGTDALAFRMGGGSAKNNNNTNSSSSNSSSGNSSAGSSGRKSGTSSGDSSAPSSSSSSSSSSGSDSDVVTVKGSKKGIKNASSRGSGSSSSGSGSSSESEVDIASTSKSTASPSSSSSSASSSSSSSDGAEGNKKTQKSNSSSNSSNNQQHNNDNSSAAAGKKSGGVRFSSSDSSSSSSSALSGSGGNDSSSSSSSSSLIPISNNKSSDSSSSEGASSSSSASRRRGRRLSATQELARKRSMRHYRAVYPTVAPDTLFAVVTLAGKQYKVAVGDVVNAEYLRQTPVATTLHITPAIVGNATQTLVGRPTVQGATVVLNVESHEQDQKVIVFKKRRRKRYQRTAGHRREVTRIRVEAIHCDMSAY